jgi:hypothetical protein
MDKVMDDYSFSYQIKKPKTEYENKAQANSLLLLKNNTKTLKIRGSPDCTPSIRHHRSP